MKLSEVDLTHFDEDVIGFKLAPQLNALGRLDDPNPAIDLLTGFDDEELHELALMISSKNEERKALVQEIFAQAMAMVDLDKPVQVLAKSGWHPGVLGIVAGRIMEEIGQTVLVLTIAEGLAKGSARSLESINIFEALNSNRSLFTAFGGHEGAAGMTLPSDRLEELSELLCQYVAAKGHDGQEKNTLLINGELDLEALSIDSLNKLLLLAPFGMDNKKPVFYLKDFTIKQARTIGQQQSHLKFKVSKGAVEADVLAFGQGHLIQEYQQSQGLELAVSLAINRWRGHTSLQLMLVDARVTGVQLFDIRARTARAPEHIPTALEDQQAKVVVIDEVPDDIDALKALFRHREFEAIYFKNHIKHPYYLTGYGSREQFAKLYRTIYQYPEFDLRHKLTLLSDYLKIEKILLVKMIQIFEELGFVVIEDGLMRVKTDAPKRSIADSVIYQQLKELVKFQELMALGSPQEIYQYLVTSEKK